MMISSLKFWMANLAKLEFAALDLSGDNYLSWVLDAKIHLRANGLGQTIVDENDASPEENAKAMIFLRRHIHEALKSEYVVVDEPLVMWKALGERYDHQKTSVSEYNSAMHRITSLMRLCGENISEEDMLEKTLSTFHASNVLLQQQYRHSESPISPNGSAPLPEINAASQEVNATSSRGSIHKRGRGGKRGHWKGSRKNRGARSEGLGPRSGPSTNGKNASRNKGKAQMSHMWCKGTLGARMSYAQAFGDLYQASLKNRKVEINYIDHALPATDGSSEISLQLNKTHLDVLIFLFYLFGGMDVNYGYPQNKGYGKDICLADSATTHTILQDRKYFSKLMLTKAKVTTISGPANLIEGSGIAQIMLPNGTILSIPDALYSSNSRRNLLSFKDIRLNGYHVETKKEENMEYLCITSSDTQKRILEKLCELSSGLYYTTIRTIEAHSVVDQESIDSNAFKLWHDRLGHPGSTMMRRIITNSKGHPLLTKHIMLSSDIFCQACSQGKLVIRPSQPKVDVESPSFLQRIQGDICGPIHPHVDHFDTLWSWWTHLPDGRMGEKSVSKEQGKLIPEKRHELSWNVSTLSHFDPHTAQCENEVRRIVHLQSIANQMPDAFNDAAKVTKSHIPAANAPARIDVHNGQSNVPANGSSAARLKRGRPLGSKDSVPRKRKLMDKMNPNEINREPTIHNSNAPKRDRNEMIIDDIFAFTVAAEIIKDDDIEPCSINECTQRQDWPKWKDAIQAELNSLEKRSVFGHIVPTPPNVNPVGYKWVFTRKRNEKNEISRYKARLVAQEKLEMRLMDVITAYLYGELDTDIYMKVPEGFRLPEAARNKPRGMFSVKLRRSLYGQNNLDECGTIVSIEHSANGILVHQSTYTEKVLKRFGMDKAQPLSTPMVVRLLDTKKDPYRPKGDDEMVLGPEVPYLSAIGALLYLAQCTRPDISFSVNLLARYSSAPTRRHWTGIKHVLRYLRGTTDMGLFYSSESTNAQSIVGYADAGYLSDPHQGRSQTGYVFYMWRNCNLMALNETNISGHIFQSLRNTCPP
ncbi:Disease resistance protein CC-NBS-LRR class family [Prunus dulcis]|uniref:Disease resistance protein CC-NBS-LRR class family n=1 Tax=Prunus dulcis TaxID=3755 RepID=A0A5H2XK55_PRUDU|nr:Disease resistance protein CC-NBS-LRR class family [Prunus dulcis]